MTQMLTDKNLVYNAPHPAGLDGEQRIYDFGNGHGLSLVNSKILHRFKFAWEAIILKDLHYLMNEKRYKFEFDYSTPFSDDIRVFKTDEDTNAFIEEVRLYFQKGEIG